MESRLHADNCSFDHGQYGDLGGGAHELGFCTLNNCTLTGNSASVHGGGGAYGSTLNNCTLTGNSAQPAAGGLLWHAQQLHADGQFGFLRSAAGSMVARSTTASSITTPPTRRANYSDGTLNYCCTTPLPSQRHRQHHRRAATGQRLASERRFSLPRGGQRRLRHRRGH